MNNSRILRTKNAKFSEHYFYLNTNMYGNFQICISVPLNLLEKDTPRIYERDKESELIKQKLLYEKRLDEINDLNMKILEAMLKSENTEK